MPAYNVSTPLRLQFDTDTATRDYFVVQELRAGIESVDAGIAPKRLQAQLAVSALQDGVTGKIRYPADFYNPRIRRDLWRPGRLINAEFLVNGAWQPHPMFPAYLLREPAPPTPSSPVLSLDLGCKLAFLLTQDEPDEDASEVDLGTVTNLSEISRRLLIAGGFTNAEISLTPDWGYSANFPIPKTTGASYIQQASGLAEAANRVLFQDVDGIIRDRPLFQFDQPPLTALTYGADEILLEEAQEESAPPNTARVVGNGRDTDLSQNIQTEISEITGPISGIVEGGAGIGMIVRTVLTEIWNETDPNQYIIQIDTRYDRIAAAVSPKFSLQSSDITVEDRREVYTYDSKKRLAFYLEQVRYPRVVIAPEVDTDLTLDLLGRETRIAYTYSAEDEIDEIVETRNARKRLIWDETPEDDWFEMVDSARVVKRWRKLPDGGDFYSEQNLQPMAQIDPESIETDDDAFRLVADFRATPPDPKTPRPGVQTYQRPGQGDQTQLEATCTFAHPGGNIGRDRKRTWEIYPALEEPQLKAVAKAKGALVWGRAQAQVMRLPVQKVAAIAVPNWRLDINYPERRNRLSNAVISAERTETYLVDSMVWSHTGDTAEALLMLAWAGTVDDVGNITPPYIAS